MGSWAWGNPRRPAGGEDALVVLVKVGELELYRGSRDGSQRGPGLPVSVGNDITRTSDRFWGQAWV